MVIAITTWIDEYRYNFLNTGKLSNNLVALFGLREPVAAVALLARALGF